MIAALFVERNGVYWNLDNVDPWDAARDARLYDGPHPVVAHPPCARWGRYWFGGPTWIAQGRERKAMGDDDDCFAAALRSVRRFGGVIEHPEGSHAWRAFGLNAPPRGGGWAPADWIAGHGGWTCCVEQGWYGHRARKATWLYAVGADCPRLRWGDSGKRAKIDLGCHSKAERARIIKTGIVQQMSKLNRARTPLPFRDLLLSIARTAGQRLGGGTNAARLCGDKPFDDRADVNQSVRSVPPAVSLHDPRLTWRDAGDEQRGRQGCCHSRQRADVQ